jgi:hypothetical protein
MKFMKKIILLIAVTCLLSQGFAKNQEGVIKQSSNLIEGTNYEGARWAYEFLENKTSGNPSILDNPYGAIVFQNSEWIVKASQESGNVGNVKTDLFFYDSRTLDLVGSVRIPNKVIKVGAIGSAFYVATITPGKYRYDDAPLAICLIDPKTKDIDRIKLVEDDYWFALRNPIFFTSQGNTIQVTCDPAAKPSGVGKPSGYLQSAPQNPHFSSVRISLRAGSSADMANLGEPIEASKKEFKVQAENGLAALKNVGALSYSSTAIDSDTTEKASVGNVMEGKSKGLHFVRSTPVGTLHDIRLDTLNSESVKVGSSAPQSPGVFADGTLRCVIDDLPVILKTAHPLKVELDKSMISFNENHAFAMHPPVDNLWWKKNLVTNPGVFTYIKINSSGDKEKKDLPHVNCNNNEDIAVYPSQNIFYTYKNEDLTNVFCRFDLLNGKQIGSQIRTETGKSGNVACIRDGLAPKGWHITSVVTDYSTQGAGYSVLAQRDQDSKEIWLVNNLSELADPLEMRLGAGGIIQLLYSCGGVTKYEDYTPEGKLRAKIAEWKSPPLEGKPLLLSEKNLIFIPKAGGYDAYRIFGEGKPDKAFEIYSRGSSDYVILLPNGTYAGSPGCERLITLQAGNGKVDATALAPWRNRPAEVIKALGGDPKTADVLAKVTERWLKRSKFDSTQPEPKASEIPKVAVNQMPPLWAQSAGVTFPIEVSMGASPLKEVTIRVNGIPKKTISGSDLKIPSGGKGTVQGPVTLAQGQNWIEVTATDEKGRVSNQARFRTILPKASETPRRYIVAMGCSEYDRPGLNLQYAAKDAGDVLKTFQEAGGRECKTLLLTNKEVGPEALEKIKAFVADSKESDEVILFCAGHGLLDEHLDYVYAGHQIDTEHPGDTGIHLDALLDAIGSGKSLKRLVLMDTCQSGSVGEKEEMKLAQASTELPKGVRAVKSRALKVVGTLSLAGADQQRFIEEMFLLPGQYRGINIIGASGGAEYAMESDKWNNGVFTSALIEALRDQKADMDHRGRISVSDLKTYLGQRVSELTGGAQKPSVVAFEQDQDFDLVGKMPPIPESVKNNTGARASEAPAPSVSSATTGESSSMAPTTLGSQFVNSLGQKFVPIPGTPVYFCAWSTRVSDYGQFVKETARAWKPAGFPQKPDHPAVRISYQDATAFCEWLTQKEHAMGKLPANLEYRLPKDLEWSTAAGITAKEVDGPPAWRSGSIPSCYAWGSSWPPPKGSGNYDPKMKTDSFPNTSPVGSFAPNRFGLFDINGNAYQWMLEDFDESGQGCLRGGSWADEEEESINLTNRFPAGKDSQGKCYGFRCVISPVANRPK